LKRLVADLDGNFDIGLNIITNMPHGVMTPAQPSPVTAVDPNLNQLQNPEQLALNLGNMGQKPRKSEFIGNQVKKPKIMGRLQSHVNVPSIPNQSSSRASSINYNPMMSRQTSYRGDSFGEEGSKS
jgi:hypothetical protein